MIKTVKNIWSESPLLVITFLAILIRLISVFFATGYGYHDDHFLVINPAQGWLDGIDLNNMIVNSPEENSSGRSLLYPFLHYLIFGFLELIGITEPTTKMLVIRLLHTLLFVTGIRWAYRLSLLLTNKKNAGLIGILLALFWMFHSFLLGL